MKKIISLIAFLSLMSVGVFAQTSTITKIHTMSNPAVWSTLDMKRGQPIVIQGTYSGFVNVTKIDVQFSNNWGGDAQFVEVPVAAYDGTIDASVTVPADYPLHVAHGGTGDNQNIKVRIHHDGGIYYNLFPAGTAQTYKMIRVEENVISVTGVTVTPETVEITVGATTTELTATVSPIDATNDSVVWSSDDIGVATVDAVTGLVTGVATGSANITATTKDGALTDACAVTVSNNVFNVTGVTIDLQSTEIDKLDSLTLITTFTPANATNKNVTWTSLTPAVATVGVDGEVKGVDYGTAKIVVETVDGNYKDTCDVTVVQAAFISLNNTSSYVDPNEFLQGATMGVSVDYSAGANRTVDENGIKFWLRFLESSYALVEDAGGNIVYDHTALETSYASTQSGTATHSLDLTNTPLTDTITAGRFLWLRASFTDDQGGFYDAKTGNNSGAKILIVESFTTGLRVVEHRMSVYPNPAENMIFIEGMQGNVKASIFSLDGKQLMKQELGSERSINVSQVARGNYILQVQDEIGVNAQMITIK